MGELTLKVITPTGANPPVECDGINLTVCDDKKGNSGGSYGIRRGHVRSLMSLDNGIIRATLNGKTVFEAKSGKGFASIENNTVTVVTESIEL